MEFAKKITKNIYTYQLTGFGKYISYNANNRSLILHDAETGAPLKIVEKDEDLDFDTFVLVAKNMFLDVVEQDHFLNLETWQN